MADLSDINYLDPYGRPKGTPEEIAEAKRKAAVKDAYQEAAAVPSPATPATYGELTGNAPAATLNASANSASSNTYDANDEVAAAKAMKLRQTALDNLSQARTAASIPATPEYLNNQPPNKPPFAPVMQNYLQKPGK